MLNKKIIIPALIVLVILWLLFLSPYKLGSSSGSSNGAIATTLTCRDNCRIVCDEPTRPLSVTGERSDRPTDTNPNLPYDASSCRNYATLQGFSASGYSQAFTSQSACNLYIQDSYKCTAPSKVSLVNNCCMWSC